MNESKTRRGRDTVKEHYVIIDQTATMLMLILAVTACFKGGYTSTCFHHFIYGNKFHDFLFASLTEEVLQKRGLFLMKKIAP